MSTDDNFEPYWLDENDWLVTVFPLPNDEDDPEVNLETLNWIGRLFGFATATNTRMLALVGDPELPAYEILFSFDCAESHDEFLRLVGADGYADASEFTVPSRDEIAEARPVGMIPNCQELPDECRDDREILRGAHQDLTRRRRNQRHADQEKQERQESHPEHSGFTEAS